MIPLLLGVALAGASPIDTLDVGYHNAAGGAVDGLWVRAEHDARLSGSLVPVVGLSAGLFQSGQGWEEGQVRVTGSIAEAHLQAHGGLSWRGGARFQRWGELGLYGGGYLYHSQGSWTQSDLGVSHEVGVTALLPDWGLRLALGGALTPRWGLQLSAADSLRRISASEGLLGGVITADADAKLVVGLEVRVRLGAIPPKNPPPPGAATE